MRDFVLRPGFRGAAQHEVVDYPDLWAHCVVVSCTLSRLRRALELGINHFETAQVRLRYYHNSTHYNIYGEFRYSYIANLDPSSDLASAVAIELIQFPILGSSSIFPSVPIRVERNLAIVHP